VFGLLIDEDLVKKICTNVISEKCDLTFGQAPPLDQILCWYCKS